MSPTPADRPPSPQHHVHTPRDDQGYVDLRSYAAIGDGRTVALVAHDARIDWLPVPNLVSASPFAAVLDAEHGGQVEVLLDGRVRTTTRAYVEGTNVLATTLVGDRQTVRVTDSLSTGVAGRLPWTELARRLECTAGSGTVRVVITPGTCLNAASPWIEQTPHGPTLRIDGLTLGLVCSEGCRVEVERDRIVVLVDLAEGERAVVGLVGTEREPLHLPTPTALDHRVDHTVDNWRSWTAQLQPDGPWADQVRRSVLALKLLVHAPSGAVAAAATTSLPESLQGGKNWDYRFAWVRDMAYTLTVLLRLDLQEETHAATSWLVSTIAEHGPDLQIFYDLGGTGGVPEESEALAPGWRGIGPVVWGNRAADQLQLGVYGDLFSIVHRYVEAGNVLDAETGRTLGQLADLTCDQWRSQDAGMWELPEQRHYTTSKMGAWQALTLAARLGELGQVQGSHHRWATEAERVREWIEEHGWSETRGAYTWHPGTDELDASVLLHAISGYDRGERMSRTIDALREELSDGPHLHRFSGAAQEEGAFVACAFWLVSALALVGRADEARALMDQLVAQVPNDVGLMAEMVDPATGDHLGNLPQALSHLALIGAAMTLDEAG